MGAAALILTGLAVAAVLMLPPYFQNLEFQRYLEQVVRQVDVAAYPPDLVRAQVLNKAAGMGLPVRGDQVSVERSGGGYRIRVLYIRRVDLLLYTVDLHFRSSAGN
jgi:hypothetical protein